MPRESEIIQRVKAAQQTLFRVACRDHGLTLKAISLDSGINYDSVCNYAKGETQMPVCALYALVGVIPNGLLSLLLPEGQAIVTVPAHIDHDAVSEAVQDYLAAKEQAHRQDSECGPAIGPNEDNVLRGKFAAVRAA